MFDSRYADRLIDALHDYLNAVDRSDRDEMHELALLIRQELATPYVEELINELADNDGIFEPKRKTLEEEAAELAGLMTDGSSTIGTRNQWEKYDKILEELKENLK